MPAGKFMHDDMSTTSMPSNAVPDVSFARLPSDSTFSESELDTIAMCGRLGSTLTVCASPTCTVIPISLGCAGFVMSSSSSPPRGAC